jgi:hypothetical protein
MRSDPFKVAWPRGLTIPVPVKVNADPAALPERKVPLAVPDKLTTASLTGLVATIAAAA